MTRIATGRYLLCAVLALASGLAHAAAPTISGAVAGQAVNDTATIDPFTGVTIDDADGDNVSVIVDLDDGAKGVVTNLGSFTDDGGGSYSLASTTTAAATTAIQALTFDPAENRVAVGGTETTTFTITVDDGTNQPSDNTTTVISTSINDAPALTAASPSLGSIDENTASAGMTAGTILGSNLSDADTSASEGIAIVSATGNGTWQYSTNSGVSWSGLGSVSAGNALLLRDVDSVRYIPDNENGETATFGFIGWDQTSGSEGAKVDASTTGGTAAFSTVMDTASITVTDVNDAPVLSPSVITLTDVAEDTGAPSGAVGDLVSSIVTLGGNVADVDNGAVTGIAVTAADAGNGTWHFSTDGGTNWSTLSLPGGQARLLAADANTRVYFEPDGDFNGTVDPGITFRAWDQSSGSNGATTSIGSIGGTTAFSSGTDTADITVNAIPDDPVITEGASVNVIMSEDSLPTAFSLTLNATDADEADSNLSWSISSQAANGTASATGTGASKGIGYAPDADFNGMDSFVVTVTDSTARTDTITVNVTVDPINDQPALDNSTDLVFTTIDEDETDNAGDTVSALLASGAGDPITDVDTDPEGIAITATDTANGTWQYSLNGGSTWNNFPAVMADSALLLGETDLIRFQPAPNFGGTVDPAITFQAWDQSTGTAGGTGDATQNSAGDAAFSSASETASITVDNVNDPPVADDFAAMTDEEVEFRIDLLPHISDSDTDLTPPWNKEPADENVRVTTTKGALGSAFVDSSTGEIIYTPFPEENGTDTLVYRVTDGEFSDTGEITVTVNSVNDPPLASNDSESLPPEMDSVVIDVLANDMDVDSNLDPATVAIVSGTEPENGTTTVNTTTGAITYTLDPSLPDDFAGQDTFTYEVFDDDATDPKSDTAVVAVFISPLNFVVDSLGDEDDNDISAGDLTLREALKFIADGGVITFDPALFAGSEQTIELDDALGEYIVDRDVTITGPGADLLTISALSANRVFHVQAGNVAIKDMTLAEGAVEDDNGGAVLVDSVGALSLSDVHLTNNEATSTGAANVGHGGAVHSAGVLAIVNSTLSDNTATNSGGGVYSTGTLTLTNVTITGNTADMGDGGGVLINGGAAAAANCTITNNMAQNGGGLSSVISGTTTVGNCLIAGNTAGAAPDADGLLTSAGGNIVGDTEGTSDSFDGDVSGLEIAALIDMTLQVNGGAIPTHSLLADSAAIDAGLGGAIPGGTLTDARGTGFDRVNGAAVDIGAYEVNVWTVDTTADTDDVDLNGVDQSPGTLSLREAVDLAFPGDRIGFGLAAGATITLDPAFEEIVVQTNLGIFGPGASDLTISGGNQTQILYVPVVDADVVLEDVTLDSALDADRGGGALYSFGTVRMRNSVVSNNAVTGFDGGGIHNRGMMTLSDVVLQDNNADNLGGAIVNWGGTLTLERCEVLDNEAVGLGGGVYNLLSGVLTVIDSQFTGNTTGANGGGIYNSTTGTATVTSSTLSDGEAASDGGGIANLGALTVTNSTVSGNVAGRNGGGIHHGGGTMTLINSTISNNTGDTVANGFGEGGGLHRAAGTVSLHNTLVAGNFDTADNAGTGNIRPDISGAVTSLGNNLVGNGTGTNGITNGTNGDIAGSGLNPVDPLIGPLADNGGLTRTHALLVQSPAIDGGDSTAFVEMEGDDPGFDQRGIGFNRIIDGNGDEDASVDIGAFEFLSATPVFTSVPVTAATEDTLYEYNIVVSDDDVDEIIAFESFTLPTWLQLQDNGDGTALLTGTPANEDIEAPFDSRDFTIDITVRDWAQLEVVQSFTLTVAGQNDPPNAVDDEAETEEDEPVIIAVLENDSDVDGDLDATSVVVVSGPPNGQTTVDPSTGEIEYTPNLDFNGVDIFTYQVSDLGTPLPAESSTAVVTVTVEAINDPPVAITDHVETDEDSVLVIDVLANDSDVDGALDPTQIFIPDPPNNGTVDVDSVTGLVTYTPDPDFNGQDMFVYRIFDDGSPAPPNASDAEVFVTVNPVNDPPVVAADTATTEEDTPVVVTVLSNDFDIDGNLVPSSVTVVSGPSNGSTSVNTTAGVITYIPTAEFSGQDQFTYRVTDDGTPLPGASSDGTVTVTVGDFNDPPELNTDRVFGKPNEALIIHVLGNDNDPDGDLVIDTMSIVSAPGNGETVVNADGTVTYTPDFDFEGMDTFEYEISDDGSPTPAKTSTGTAIVTIAGVSGSPQTFHVDSTVAASGDGSAGSPFATLQEAADAAQAFRNDRIRISRGTYTGPVAFKPGTIVTSIEGAFHTLIGAAKAVDEVVTLDAGVILRGVTVIGGAAAIQAPAFTEVEITNCVLVNGQIGVRVGHDANVVVNNNTFYGNTLAGIWVEPDAMVDSLRSNAFVNNEIAVKLQSGGLVSGGFNLFDANAVSHDGTSPFPSDLFASPQFVDETDLNFHLRSGSPARDAGQTGAAFNDLDGTRNDIGADGGPNGVIDNHVPKAVITATPLQGDVPLQVDVSGANSSDEWGIASYEWDFDALNGFQVETVGVDASTIYSQESTYRITLRVTDHSGLQRTTSTEVVVGTPPDVEVSVSPNVGPAPLTVTFTTAAVDPDGGPLTYAWDFDGTGQFTSSEASPVFTYPEGTPAARYRPTVTVTDDEGGVTQRSVDVHVTVNAPLAAEEIDAATGGTVIVPDLGSPLDGTSVVIPPDALGEPTLITVEEVGDLPGMPDFTPIISVKLGPPGTQFAEPVTITIPLPDDASPNLDYTVEYFNELEQVWKTDGIFDIRVIPFRDGHAVRFKTSHFTVFTVVLKLQGDVNRDGVVNAIDVQLVINAALGMDIGADFEADVNGDSVVNALDVQVVINAALS